jgi:elongation factor 2 kinase
MFGKIIQLYITAELYNQAAEGAMAAMKGRLANKYYALAEEAAAEIEEEE